jgi:hypothetical protein
VFFNAFILSLHLQVKPASNDIVLHPRHAWHEIKQVERSFRNEFGLDNDRIVGNGDTKRLSSDKKLKQT